MGQGIGLRGDAPRPDVAGDVARRASPLVSGLLPRWRGAAPTADKPFRDDLLSVERLDGGCWRRPPASPSTRTRDVAPAIFFPATENAASCATRIALADDVRSGY